MAAIRILLISQILACLLVLVLACLNPVTFKTCVPFTGLHNCVNPNIEEPKLPPRDNACCGPHCIYTAINPPRCCNDTVQERCLLDTHCDGNVAFTFKNMSGCTLQCINEQRNKDGFARLISFDMDEDLCLLQNTKCGINCCCRETCPTHFCKIQKVTKCL